MKRKKVLIVFCVILFLIINCKVFGYSNDIYSIEIPSTYTKVSENSFTDATGKNINIQIVPFSSSTGAEYTEKTLNTIAESAEDVEAYRNEMKKVLKEKNEKYGSTLSEKEINEYVNSYKCDSIVLKEITKFSKNNYKCYHIIAKYSMGDAVYYVNQYSVASGNNIFTLSLTSDSDKSTEDLTTKAIINSFTIKNYSEPKSKLYNILVKASVGFVSSLIIIVFSSLFNRKRKNKIKESDLTDSIEDRSKLKQTNKHMKEDTISKNIPVENTKKIDGNYCTNCGKKIDYYWQFCNYCGCKIEGGKKNE